MVLQTLEAKGVMSKIRAEMRACVFTAIEQEEKKPNSSIYLSSAKREKIHESQLSNLLGYLVCEYLSFHELDYTLSVFESEANLSHNFIKREELVKNISNGDVDASKPQALLLQIMNAFINSQNQNSFAQTTSAAEMIPPTTTSIDKKPIQVATVETGVISPKVITNVTLVEINSCNNNNYITKSMSTKSLVDPYVAIDATMAAEKNNLNEKERISLTVSSLTGAIEEDETNDSKAIIDTKKEEEKEKEKERVKVIEEAITIDNSNSKIQNPSPLPVSSLPSVQVKKSDFSKKFAAEMYNDNMNIESSKDDDDDHDDDHEDGDVSKIHIQDKPTIENNTQAQIPIPSEKQTVVSNIEVEEKKSIIQLAEDEDEIKEDIHTEKDEDEEDDEDYKDEDEDDDDEDDDEDEDEDEDEEMEEEDDEIGGGDNEYPDDVALMENSFEEDMEKLQKINTKLAEMELLTKSTSKNSMLRKNEVEKSIELEESSGFITSDHSASQSLASDEYEFMEDVDADI